MSTPIIPWQENVTQVWGNSTAALNGTPVTGVIHVYASVYGADLFFALLLGIFVVSVLVLIVAGAIAYKMWHVKELN